MIVGEKVSWKQNSAEEYEAEIGVAEIVGEEARVFGRSEDAGFLAARKMQGFWPSSSPRISGTPIGSNFKQVNRADIFANCSLRDKSMMSRCIRIILVAAPNSSAICVLVIVVLACLKSLQPLPIAQFLLS
jgi:hypothetical protein